VCSGNGPVGYAADMRLRRQAAGFGTKSPAQGRVKLSLRNRERFIFGRRDDFSETWHGKFFARELTDSPPSRWPRSRSRRSQRRIAHESRKQFQQNGASGTSDIEGKATRVGASERGQRASFKVAKKTKMKIDLPENGPLASFSLCELGSSRAGAQVVKIRKPGTEEILNRRIAIRPRGRNCECTASANWQNGFYHPASRPRESRGHREGSLRKPGRPLATATNLKLGNQTRRASARKIRHEIDFLVTP